MSTNHETAPESASEQPSTIHDKPAGEPIQNAPLGDRGEPGTARTSGYAVDRGEPGGGLGGRSADRGEPGHDLGGALPDRGEPRGGRRFR